MRRVHRLRRDQREDVAHVVLAHPRLLVGIELLERSDPHADGLELGEHLLEDVDLLLLERRDQLEAVHDLLLRRASIRSDGVDLRADLLLEAADALLEELVDVRADDGDELRALEERDALVIGFLKDAPAEVQVGQLAVEIQLVRTEIRGRLLVDARRRRRPAGKLDHPKRGPLARELARRFQQDIDAMNARNLGMQEERALGGHRP